MTHVSHNAFSIEFFPPRGPKAAARLDTAMDQLATLGPAATLARGYAVVQGLPTDGPPHVLHSVNDAPAGARLRIRVADGALTALSEGAVDDEQGGADEAH